MSNKNGKYLKQASKKRKKKNAAIPVLLGTIVILAVAVAVMLLIVQNRSVYQVIVHEGYTGTQEQWLASLVGEETDANVESAYELAIRNGYKGSETEWIKAIVGVSIDTVEKSPYQLACENGFKGSLTEWLTQLAEKIRFSDPMSNEQLADMENKISVKVMELKTAANKVEIITELTSLLDDRNKKCKILKYYWRIEK